jgi:hypothetical protein
MQYKKPSGLVMLAFRGSVFLVTVIGGLVLTGCIAFSYPLINPIFFSMLEGSMSDPNQFTAFFWSAVPCCCNSLLGILISFAFKLILQRRAGS